MFHYKIFKKNEEYTYKVEMIPSNIVANIFRFKSKQMFEIENEELENVKISF